MTNVTYPGGLRVRYACDADGRVTNVTDWAGRAWTFTRDAAGRFTALSCPNGVAGSWTHDANHKVSGWGYNNGSPLAGRTITRDEAGVKLKEQVTAGLFPNPQSPRRAQNTFDAADRLVSAQVVEGTNTYAESYLYDLNGTLTNRYSEIGEQQYEYDCAGRLTYSLQSTANSLALTYDALGNRLTTYSANTTHIWITDHADPLKRPLMETDASGVPVRSYIWGGSFLLAVVEADGAIRYCHSDEQGSVVALTDASGTVTDQYCYGPYGTDWGHSGTNAIPFRWLGSHGVLAADALLSNSSLLNPNSSLYLTRHRAYDADLVRFLSADPSGLAGGPNLYAYCLGNPLAYVDPLGLCASSVRGLYGSTHDFLPLSFTLPVDTATGLYNNYNFYGGGLSGAALAANATFNPAVNALNYGYEAWTGLGMQYYNSGATLSGWERAGSGAIATVSAAATAGIAVGGAGVVGSFGAASGSTEMTTVTSWASEGITPDLNPGRWVQLGDATEVNFWKTGLSGPKAYLQSEAPFLKIESSCLLFLPQPYQRGRLVCTIPVTCFFGALPLYALIARELRQMKAADKR